MGTSRQLLEEVARDLDAISERTRTHTAEVGPSELSLVDDLRRVTLKIAVVVERLIDVTNLPTIEERVDRWPHPSAVSPADHARVP